MTEIATRAATAEAIYDGPGSLITLLTDTAELTCNTATFDEGAAGAPSTSTPRPRSSST